MLPGLETLENVIVLESPQFQESWVYRWLEDTEEGRFQLQLVELRHSASCFMLLSILPYSWRFSRFLGEANSHTHTHTHTHTHSLSFCVGDVV